MGSSSIDPPKLFSKTKKAGRLAPAVSAPLKGA
jgi:hypothetical protein